MFALTGWVFFRTHVAYSRTEGKKLTIPFSHSELELLVSVRQVGVQKDVTQVDKVIRAFESPHPLIRRAASGDKSARPFLKSHWTNKQEDIWHCIGSGLALLDESGRFRQVPFGIE